MKKEQFYPKILQCIGIVVYYFLTVNVALIIGFRYKCDIELSLMLGSTLAILLLIFWVRRKYSLNIKNLFNNISEYFKFIIPLFLIAVGMIIFNVNIITAIGLIMPPPEVQFSTLWKELLGTALIIPLIEEIIYRGIILRGLLNHYSTNKAIIISAILFAISHGNVWQLAGAFFIGIVSAILFLKTRSLFPSCFIHMMNNFIIVLCSKSQWLDNHFDGVKFIPLWMDLIGIALFVIGIISLQKIFKNNKLCNENVDII